MKLGRVELEHAPNIAASFRDGASSAEIKKLKSSGIKIIELRIDAFKRHDAEHVLREIKRFKAFARLATIRSQKEGGVSRLSDGKRLELFNKIIPAVDAVDIELSSAKILKTVVREAKRRKKCVIISYHNFKKTPSLAELNKIALRAKNAGADIVKIAAMAHDEKHVETVTEWLLTGKTKNKIAIAMGEKGAASRVFLPVIGSLLAYAHTGKATAPGQLEVTALSALFKNIRFN